MNVEGEMKLQLLMNLGAAVVDGSNWGWADWDAPRKRIVFAEDGMICSLALRENRSRKILFDCNALKYERRLAPY